MNQPKELESKVVYKNNRFSVIETDYSFNNESDIYPYFTIHEKNGFVTVIGVDKDRIMMVKQYRIPIKKISYEFVGGYIEDGETPENAASREFLEESGYSCEEVINIGKFFPAVNKSSVNGNVFIAIGLNKKSKDLDKFEKLIGLKSGFVEENKIYKMISDGLICDATTIAAWYLYLEYMRG